MKGNYKVMMSNVPNDQNSWKNFIGDMMETTDNSGKLKPKLSKNLLKTHLIRPQDIHNNKTVDFKLTKNGNKLVNNLYSLNDIKKYYVQGRHYFTCVAIVLFIIFITDFIVICNKITPHHIHMNLANANNPFATVSILLSNPIVINTCLIISLIGIVGLILFLTYIYKHTKKQINNLTPSQNEQQLKQLVTNNDLKWNNTLNNLLINPCDKDWRSDKNMIMVIIIVLILVAL